MCVRRGLILLVVGALAFSGPVSGSTGGTSDPTTSEAEECSIAVCAEARATISTSCHQGTDPYTGEAFVACTLRFVATAAGSSPLMLPGDVTGSGRAEVEWSCTPGFCNAKRVRDSAEYATYWDAGPHVPEAGLVNGASRTMEIARITIGMTAPPGTIGPCLEYDATLVNEATATVPRLDPPLPPTTLDEAVAVDDAARTGSACFQ